MFFYNQELYFISADEKIKHVSSDFPPIISVYDTILLPPFVGGYGIVSVPYDCDSATVFINATDSLVYRYVMGQSEVYQECGVPYVVYGSTAPGEFLSSDCILVLDLNTSLPDSNFQQQLCIYDGPLSVMDSTISLFSSGARPDSLRIRLSGAVPDAPLEYLSAVPNAYVNISGQGTSSLLMTRNTAAGGALHELNKAFESAMTSVRWHNDSPAPANGERVIELIAWAGSGLNDTARIFLRYDRPDAGADTSVVVCSNGNALDLESLIPVGNSGGALSPATVDGDFVFDPQQDMSGIYTYVASADNCPSDTAQIQISVVSAPLIELGNDTLICGQPLFLLAADTIVAWSDGSVSDIITITGTALIWAEVVNADWCSARDSIQITLSSATAFNLGADTTICNSATFSLALNEAVQWSDGSSGNQFTAQQSGLFWAESVNPDGCRFRDSIQITFAASDILDLGPDLVFCDTPFIILQAPASVIWNDGSAGSQKNIVQSGQYWAELVNPAGCISQDTVSVALYASSETMLERTICTGDFVLFHQDTLFLPGNYTRTFQSIQGCDSTVTLHITVNPPVIPAIQGDSVLCAGETTGLWVDNPLFSAYNWSTGTTGQSITIFSGGQFAVTVSDADGCVGSDTVTVWQSAAIQADWLSAPSGCPGDSDGFIELSSLSGGTGPFVYELNGQTSSIPLFENLPPGTYQLLVTDVHGCAAADQVIVSSFEVPQIDLGNIPILQSNEPYTIPSVVTGAGPFTYSWQPPQGLSCIDCLQPVATVSDSSVFTVVVTDANGCTANAMILLAVKKAIKEGVFIPNAFTPNGDPLNGIFTILADPAKVAQVDLLQIYNRWGEMVFEQNNFQPNNSSFGWNGQINGKTAPAEVYVYYTKIQLTDGTVLEKTGDVTLLR